MGIKLPKRVRRHAWGHLVIILGLAPTFTIWFCVDDANAQQRNRHIINETVKSDLTQQSVYDKTDVAEALNIQTKQIKSVDFLGSDPRGYAIFSEEASGFPVNGKSYLALSSGCVDMGFHPEQGSDKVTLSWDLQDFSEDWEYFLMDQNGGYEFRMNMNEVPSVTSERHPSISQGVTLQLIPKPSVPTQTVGQSVDRPEKIILYQNYPNPFNPSTTITFSISEAAEVQLDLYDSAGRHIEKLLNKPITTGTHKIPFNASALPSGVYFYSLRAGSVTRTRVMTLQK